MAEHLDYYTAAIVHWMNKQREDHFQYIDIRDWTYEREDRIARTRSKAYFLENDELTISALNLLVQRQLVTKITDQYGPDIYQIVDGISLQVLANNDIDSVYYKVDKFGEPWLIAALEKIHAELNGEGTDKERDPVLSDVEWHPLKIDRSSAEFSNALEEIEEALKKIENDNGYADKYPEERAAILEPAKGTLVAIKEGTPSKEQIDSNLLKPFKYLTKKFADSAIGIAAKKLVEAIIKWLPELFS